MNFPEPQWPKSLPPESVANLATLGPLGTKMKAPGTWGAAAGTVFFGLFLTDLSVVGNLIASALLGYFAVGICGLAALRMGRRDPGEVILDEFVAMPLCFLGWRMIVPYGFLASLAVLAVGFGIFRFFDIRKPWVIDSLQELPGGWGIVIDDTAAALATCGTLHLLHALWVLV
jgi:phosphatidylglycerophosphatase A